MRDLERNVIMEAGKALEIIRALADGIDPHTGEVYPADSPYQSPEITRALFAAISALDGVERRERRKRTLQLSCQPEMSSSSGAAAQG